MTKPQQQWVDSIDEAVSEFGMDSTEAEWMAYKRYVSSLEDAFKGALVVIAVLGGLLASLLFSVL